MELPLACTVRGCGLPLERRPHAFVCPGRHAYDVARSGYVNLLQPQDRRSPAAGDSKSVVEARAALLAAGVGGSLTDAIVRRVHALGLPGGAIAVDLGCGAGDTLMTLVRDRALTGIGIDLSAAAIARAARQFPATDPPRPRQNGRGGSQAQAARADGDCVMWVVANADRRLPLLDRSVHVVLSRHGRRNPGECARVLVPGGRLLVAVPAPDDLIELRTLVQGRGFERDRGASVLADHEAAFRLVDRDCVREHHRVDREGVRALLLSTYRGARRAAADRAAALDQLDVTVAADVFLLAPR